MTNSPATTTTTPVVPSEVGWQFVPQYYTFVNKQPHRLHCFYTKASTFIHGTEGEDGKPCHGQQEIHNKITSIGFQDCKVFIHSVDAQASAAGGIIIQVIGEMSNHGDPWRKFAQTFFLAEQPGGYFVLNDIFRFLKEETAESDEGEAETDVPAPATAPVTEPVAVASPVPAALELIPEPPREPSPPPAPPVAAPTPVLAAPPPPAEEAPTTDVPEPPTIIQTPTPAPEPAVPVVTQQPNGIHTPEPENVAPVPAIAEESPASEPVPLPATPTLPAATTPTPPPAPVPAAAAPQVPPVPPPASAPSPAPAPVPAGPRSWASLAASNSKKWGAAVAQESRGVTETPVTPVSSGTQTPPSGGPGPRGPPYHHQHQHQHQHHQHHGPGGPSHPHPAYLAAQSLTIAQVFVKGVTEPISNTALTNVLVNRFGPIKDLDIVRSKACAFLEFLSLDAAKRAIIASLPQSQGGEGGIWIDVGGEAGTVRISVETKKERGDRPVSRPRGGPPPVVNGEGGGRGAGQGSYVRGAGRGGPGGRGRGGVHVGPK